MLSHAPSCRASARASRSGRAEVYERFEGAAALPLPRGYLRREPERSVLYRVVQEQLETFLAEGRARTEHGFGYPAFVEKEFRAYLSCGVLSEGFA